MTPAGNTALSCAARSGNLAVVQYLIEAGADVHTLDVYQRPALEFAVHLCYTDISRLLIANGASVHTVNHSGRTLPMTVVGTNRRLEMFQILLAESSAEFRAIDATGSTILHRCAYDGSIEVIDLLIRCGVDISHKNHRGLTAMHIAAGMGRDEILETMFSANKDIGMGLIHETSNAGLSCLHWAVTGLGIGPPRDCDSVARTIAFLLQKGADEHVRAEISLEGQPLFQRGFKYTPYDLAKLSSDPGIGGAYEKARELVMATNLK